MKGIVFNLLEEVVRTKLGEDARDDLLDAAGLDGSYTSLGSYPDVFTGHQISRSFLFTLNSIIHPEVRKVYPGADVPSFEMESGPDDPTMLLGYRSARRLCALAEGFIAGTADHFRENVAIEQVSCMQRGDERRLLKIDVSSQAA